MLSVIKKRIFFCVSYFGMENLLSHSSLSLLPQRIQFLSARKKISANESEREKLRERRKRSISTSSKIVKYAKK